MPLSANNRRRRRTKATTNDELWKFAGRSIFSLRMMFVLLLLSPHIFTHSRCRRSVGGGTAARAGKRVGGGIEWRRKSTRIQREFNYGTFRQFIRIILHFPRHPLPIGSHVLSTHWPIPLLRLCASGDHYNKMWLTGIPKTKCRRKLCNCRCTCYVATLAARQGHNSGRSRSFH